MHPRIVKLFLALVLCTGSLFPAFAQTPAASAGSTADQLAKLQTQVANAQSSADNAWMLVSAALVLMMTGPGLALFYGGLVRKKNVLATMMQSFAMMAIITVLWALVSYSLAFDSGTSFIGGLHHIFLRGVGLVPDTDYSATLPLQTFMIYQLMFAIITPALITGAFAERMKFSAMALFLILWSIFVYSPMAHMVWGKGGFLNASLGGRFPTLDFAGGTVVHVTSGVSALVCALYLGKRVGYPKEAMPPHSVVLSFIGACLLWVGWFGFNAGSALGSGPLATSAFVNTHFGAAGAALSWMLAEWIRSGKPSALGGISGAVAGLVAITPAAGFVQPMSAIVIGLLAGAFCYFMVIKVKNWFGYDDSLDAFGVHGAGGTLGAVLTGLFASSAINPIFKDAQGNTLPSGAVDGNWHQVLNQLVGIGLAWIISIVGTLILLKLVDLTVGLRVSRDQETEGLDLTQHGEEGYDFAS
ncbi:MAG TPA: ammonium transporter [Alloacidobacterium sp.]|jgi:Amt family ammonium transporter|nr:ammonium transporter [Alloacidobacterium sp.]